MDLNGGPLGLSGDGRHLRVGAPWRETWVAPWRLLRPPVIWLLLLVKAQTSASSLVNRD